MSRKNLKNKLNVILYKPSIDSIGEYIPYCDFKMHSGIIKNTKKCIERDCYHFSKLYIPFEIKKKNKKYD